MHFGTFLIHFLYIFGTLLVHFWYIFGTLLVHFWYTFGTLLVQVCHICDTSAYLSNTLWIATICHTVCPIHAISRLNCTQHPILTDCFFASMPGFKRRLQEAATARAREEFPQGNNSKLASVLLQKWCWGLMSLPLLQMLASASVEDGLEQPLLRYPCCMCLGLDI